MSASRLCESVKLSGGRSSAAAGTGSGGNGTPLLGGRRRRAAAAPASVRAAREARRIGARPHSKRRRSGTMITSPSRSVIIDWIAPPRSTALKLKR